MALRVFNSGETTISSDSNNNTPVNPRLTAESAYTDKILATVIYENDSPSETINRMVVGENLGTEYSNLEKTEGNILKTYDSVSGDGIELTNLTYSFGDSNDFFVLVYSDDHLKHHFAKITEILTIDVANDGIKFEPSIGNEIPADVKFMLFTFPKANYKAISLGLKSDLQNELIVARPHFYFKDDLDKKDQLNFNTKYYAAITDIQLDSFTYLTASNSPATTQLQTTFLTQSNYHDSVKDYSRFGMRTKIVDNLKTLDKILTPLQIVGSLNSSSYPTEIRNITTLPTGLTIQDLLFRGVSFGGNIPEGTYISEILSSNSVRLSQSVNPINSPTAYITLSSSNESNTLPTYDLTNYHNSFYNARRDNDDLFLPHATNYSSTGITRYLHYDYSKEKSNVTYNVIDMHTNESIKKKISYSEAKIIDMFRIIPSKISENEPFRVRARLERFNLDEWADTGLIVSSISSGTEYSLTLSGEDFFGMFSANEEIKINNNIYIVKQVLLGSIRLVKVNYSSANNVYSRLETEGKFTDGGNPSISEGDAVYRRRYSPTLNKILTNIDITNVDTSDIYVSTNCENEIASYLKISNISSKNLYLTINSDKYFDNNKHLQGEAYLYYEKLNGFIDNTEYYREEGQSIMKIAGRSKLSKVLSPVINRNTAFSNDIIHSSFSPNTEIVRLTGTGNAPAFLKASETHFESNAVISVDSGGSDLTCQTYLGDRLYVKTANGTVKYLGTVVQSQNTIIHGIDDYVQFSSEATDNELYVARRNSDNTRISNFSLTKALSHNNKVDSVTSASGTSNKGLFFNSGVEMNRNGNEGDTLVLTSSSSNVNAEGYYISKVYGEINGADYQINLGDGVSSESFESFATVNTLLDFNVLEVKEGQGFKTVSIAPYVPITLGRVENNHANTDDNVYNDLGTVSSNQTGKVIEISNTNTYYNYVYELRLNDPVFGNNGFLGLFKGHVVNASANNAFISLDRTATVTSGEVLKKLAYVNYTPNKKTHQLELINTAHLHGGKIVSLVGISNINISPSNFSPVLSTLDFEMVLPRAGGNIRTSYSERFGIPKYSIYNLELGEEIGYADSYKIGDAKNYLDAYGIRRIGRTSPNNDMNILPIEARGHNPPIGSRFFDRNILSYGEYAPDSIHHLPDFSLVTDSTDRTNLNSLDAFIIKDRLDIREKSVDRMFLFINSDEYPYHGRRKDSLLNSAETRDISNYSITGIKSIGRTNTSMAKHTNLKTSSITNVDDDYTTTNIISSNRSVSELKSFGLMRLTDVVLDWHFNQIDPEKPIDPKKTIPKTDLINFTTEEAVNGVSLAESNYNTTLNTITSPVGGGNWDFAIGDVLLDTNNNIIGVCSQTSSSTVLYLYYISKTDDSGGGSLWTGGVKKLPKLAYYEQTNKITGHGKNDTFAVDNEEIHMNKTAWLNRAANQRVNYQQKVSFAKYGSSSAGAYDVFQNDFILLELLVDSIVHKYFIHFRRKNASNVFNEPATHPTYTSTYQGQGYTQLRCDFTTPYNINPDETQDGDDFVATLNADPIISANLDLLSNSGGLVTVRPTRYHSDVGTIPDNYVEGTTKFIAGTGLTSNYISLTDNTKVYSSNTLTSGYGFSPDSSYYTLHNNFYLGGNIATDLTDVNGRTANMFLPISIAYRYNSSDGTTSTSLVYPNEFTYNNNAFNSFSEVVNLLGKLPTTSNPDPIGTRPLYENIYNNFMPVSLGGFSIEDEGSKSVSDGENFSKVETSFIRERYDSTATNSGDTDERYIMKMGLKIKLGSYFGQYSNYSDFKENIDKTDYRKEGTGVHLGFRPVLKTPSTLVDLFAGTGKAINNQDIYSYSFTLTNADIGDSVWLKYFDTTGCYLVKRNSTASFNDTQPNDIIYVYSHEYNVEDTADNQVFIITSHELDTDSEYMVMQPNHNTFYEFSPKEIKIGEYSKRYTKKPNSDQCYVNINTMPFTDSSSEHNLVQTYDNEGIGSMYLIIDISGRIGSDTSPFICSEINEDYSLDNVLCISDGKTTLQTGVNVDIENNTLVFDKLENLRGITSLGEIMEVKVGNDFDSESERCVIGSAVTIASEAEDLVSELLSNENIEFIDNTDFDYPMYLAPNFEGVDLFSAIRFLLNKKEKEIVVRNDNIEIVNELSDTDYQRILLKPGTKYDIYEYERTKSVFDFYNEIIVYGSTHRSIKKNLRSVQKIGRKTLEHFDNKLVTQEAVDEKARDLLRIHSTTGDSLRLKVSSKGLEFLRSGNIIQVEIPTENIERNDYVVISVNYLLTGLMELELGSFDNKFEDIFTDLLITGKSNSTQLRKKEFTSNNEVLEMIDSLKIKELRMLIRTRESTGTPFTFGFGTTLNTNTNQLGFAGGSSILITNLLEEEL